MAYAYAAFFFGGCLGSQVLGLGKRFFELRNPDLYLMCVMLFGLCAYAMEYSGASIAELQPESSPPAVVWLAAAAVGKMVRQASDWFGAPGHRERLMEGLIGLLVAILVLTSILFSKPTDLFAYREAHRLMGPWNNPNIFGLLMSSGVVLVVGMALKMMSGWKAKAILSAIYIAAGVFMLACLIRSYSRGAWVGTICGLTYLFYQGGSWCLQRTQFARRIRRNWCPFVLLLVAALLLGFWQYRNVQERVVRRVFSVANMNDLSWRNRVEAWENAFTIMVDKPLFGVGWNQTVPTCEGYYCANEQVEQKAILVNDYLMLGCTLGLPALLCFLAYLGLSLLPIGGSPAQKICRAGAMAMLIGFWFDGGIFQWPTACFFWVLIELGREMPLQAPRARHGCKVAALNCP
jgi:O-antigen ligase